MLCMPSNQREVLTCMEKKKDSRITLVPRLLVGLGWSSESGSMKGSGRGHRST